MEKEEIDRIHKKYQAIVEANIVRTDKLMKEFIRDSTKKCADYILICSVFAFAVGFLSGYMISKADASELDDCKVRIYHQTRTVRRATEHAQNLCRAQKLPTESCDKIGREVLKETLASLPKLDNNFISKCESKGVYSSVDRI